MILAYSQVNKVHHWLGYIGLLCFYLFLSVAGPHTSSVVAAGQVEEETGLTQLTEGCWATLNEAEVMVMWWPQWWSRCGEDQSEAPGREDFMRNLEQEG